MRHRGARHAAAPRAAAAGCGELAKYHFLTGDDLDALALDERVAAACGSRPTSSPPTSARAAAGRSSTTATRWPTPSRPPAATTCATARPSPSASSTPPSWPARLGRIDDDRVAEHRARRRRLRPADRRCRPAPTPTSCVALMHRDKKAVDGLTFVLDGPDGVEVVAGVDADVAARRPGGRSDDATVAAAVGAEPEPARRPRARDLRHRHARRPRRHLHRGARRRLRRRAPPVEPRGRAGRRHPRRPRPVRGDRHQRRRLHPLRLGHPRRPRRLRRPGRRAPPVEPRRPRAVAPHLGRHPGGQRASSPASAATATASPPLAVQELLS